MQQLVVLDNEARQVMICSIDGWEPGAVLGEHVLLKPTPDGIFVHDSKGLVLGIASSDSVSVLLDASSIYLGSLRHGLVEEDAKVEIRWEMNITACE